MQKRNVFAGPYLEREAHLRSEPAWFATALADARSRVVSMWNSRNLVIRADAVRAEFLRIDEIPTVAVDPARLILLGRIGETHYFAYEFDSPEPPVVGGRGTFEELRSVAALLPAAEAGLLAYARALIYWRKRHRFCGTCGTDTSPARAGHAQVCNNSTCRTEDFPRLDPAIIVLVTDGERILLGRQASWPKGRYSTIAGFVEPGESLEDAVAREMAEETGIEVDQIVYHSSQPWPFPASLMLGFTAHAVTTGIVLRDEELEDARWFSRADVVNGRFLLPPAQSISYRLIEDWYDLQSDKPLHEVQSSMPWPA